MKKPQPPLLVRLFQCPNCILKEKSFCVYWGGFTPAMWTVTLGIFRQCMIHNRIERATPRQEVKPIPSRELKLKDLDRRAIAKKNLERQKHSQYQHQKHFKRRQPTTARKLWKPDATFEEEKQ